MQIAGMRESDAKERVRRRMKICCDDSYIKVDVTQKRKKIQYIFEVQETKDSGDLHHGTCIHSSV